MINVLNYQDYEIVPKCTVEELMKAVKSQAQVDLTLDDGKGNMFKYQYTEMDETDVANHDFRPQRPDESLTDFIEGSKDLYAEYQTESGLSESVRQTKQSISDSQRFRDLLEQAKESLIRVPSLEEYFENVANKENVFDRSNRDQNTELDEEIERIEQDQLNEQLYKRELVARLFGGSLTARQLGVLTNLMTTEERKEEISKAVQFKEKVDAKDTIRNAEELLESHRRKMVLEGKWKEQESHRKLQEELDEVYNKYPTATEFNIAKREHKKKLRSLF